MEPITTPAGPGLKNEMVLPAVLDPWAACALYEAANLAAKNPGSKLWLVSLGPKAKLQQVMMTVAQKVAFELVPIDGPIGGFPDAHSTAAVLAETIAALPGLDKTKLLLFGGSAPPRPAQCPWSTWPRSRSLKTSDRPSPDRHGLLGQEAASRQRL